MNYTGLRYMPRGAVPLEQLSEALDNELLDKAIFRMDTLVNMMERTSDVDVRGGIREVLLKIILDLDNKLDNDLSK